MASKNLERDVKTKEERGSAMIIALLMALVVTAVGTTMLVSANTDQLIAANERDSERALAAARAGLAWAYDGFANTPQELVPTDAGLVEDSQDYPDIDAALDGAHFEVTLFRRSDEQEAGDFYEFISRGYFADDDNNDLRQATRTVRMTFQSIPESLSFGLLSYNTLNLLPDSEVGSELNNYWDPALDELTNEWPRSPRWNMNESKPIDGPLFGVKQVTIQPGVYTTGGPVVSPSLVTLEGQLLKAAGIEPPAVIDDRVFTFDLVNDGVINDDVKLVASATSWMQAGETEPPVTDSAGTDWYWFRYDPTNAGETLKSPANVGNPTGTGVYAEGYEVVNAGHPEAPGAGKVFTHDLFHRNGELLDDPDLNVVSVLQEPDLDYGKMYQVAAANGTAFKTQQEVADYIMDNVVREEIDDCWWNEVSGDPCYILVSKIGDQFDPRFIFYYGEDGEVDDGQEEGSGGGAGWEFTDDDLRINLMGCGGNPGHALNGQPAPATAQGYADLIADDELTDTVADMIASCDELTTVTAPSGDIHSGIQLGIDAIHIEGGIYTAGRFAFHGPDVNAVTDDSSVATAGSYGTDFDAHGNSWGTHDEATVLPGAAGTTWGNRWAGPYAQLSINASAHCYPALIAWDFPYDTSGVTDPDEFLTIDPTTTPAMDNYEAGGAGTDTMTAESILLRSKGELVFGQASWTATDAGTGNRGRHEGRIEIDGLVLSQGRSWIGANNGNDYRRIHGAILGGDITLETFVFFSYDPAVSCTRFILSTQGTDEVVSYSEIR